jgi:phage gp36-like protein
MQDKIDALVDDEGDGSRVQERILAALEAATDEMNSYISQQYSLPLSDPVPGILTKLACDIATYAIYAHSYDEVPDTRRDRYRDALNTLEKIADGSLALTDDDGDETPTTGRVGWYAI